MKELGICSHDNVGGLVDTLEDYFIRKGVSVESMASCLCSLCPENIHIKYKTLLFHPGDDEECWEKARQAIMKNPSSKFYILCLGKPERQETIGLHKNVVYLSNLEQISSFRKNINEFLGIE